MAVVVQKSYSPPTSSDAFSSSVMAWSTASMLSRDNWGACPMAAVLMVNARDKTSVFMSDDWGWMLNGWNYSGTVVTEK